MPPSTRSDEAVAAGTRTAIVIGYSNVGTNSIWIDGLQIWLDTVTGNGNSGILTSQTGAAEHRFSNNIIRGEAAAPANFFAYGIFAFDAAPGSVVRAWNNIVYDFFRAGQGSGIAAGQGTNALTLYSYNNTVFNVARGYHQAAPATHVAKNNVYRHPATGTTAGRPSRDGCGAAAPR